MSGIFRWFLFAAYTSSFFVVPLTILWELPGFVAGAVLSVSFLFLVGFQGTERIKKRLQVSDLNVAECPHLFSIVHEYCRRLEIPVPRLGVIENRALNLAVFGFSRKSAYLVVTTGVLHELYGTSLARNSLAALVGRQLSAIWQEGFFCESWLSQFLSIMEKTIVTSARSGRGSISPRFHSLGLFLKQLVIYPLCLPPCMVLRSGASPSEIDFKSLQITQLPQPLAEGLRRLRARSDQVSFHALLSSRHLFLVPPQPRDPFARIFFGSIELGTRIQAMEKISGVAQAT